MAFCAVHLMRRRCEHGASLPSGAQGARASGGARALGQTRFTADSGLDAEASGIDTRHRSRLSARINQPASIAKLTHQLVPESNPRALPKMADKTLASLRTNAARLGQRLGENLAEHSRDLGMVVSKNSQVGSSYGLRSRSRADGGG